MTTDENEVWDRDGKVYRASYQLGEFDAYWAEMDPTKNGHPYDDEGQPTGQEPSYLQGNVVGVYSEGEYTQVTVRSIVTGRLWEVLIDESGVTVECVPSDR